MEFCNLVQFRDHRSGTNHCALPGAPGSPQLPIKSNCLDFPYVMVPNRGLEKEQKYKWAKVSRNERRHTAKKASRQSGEGGKHTSRIPSNTSLRTTGQKSANSRASKQSAIEQGNGRAPLTRLTSSQRAWQANNRQTASRQTNSRRALRSLRQNKSAAGGCYKQSHRRGTVSPTETDERPRE